MIKDEAGKLTDLKDGVFWRSGEGGPALDATDTHSVPADPVFALKTTTGGALVFDTTAAQLTLTPAGRRHHQRPHHPRLLLGFLISGTDLRCCR